MSDTILHDPILKQLLRWGWSAVLGGHALLSTLRPRTSDGRRVYFGGAIPGDIGGPLVKVKRLRQHFSEDRWRFNVVYVLSNTPYLPKFALKIFKRRGIPIVHNQNGVFYPAWFAGDWQSRNVDMARPYHLADHVFYQSRFCQTAADRFLGKRSGPGEILYNAVDTSHFSPKPSTTTHGKSFRFLVTGKIDHHLYYRLESSLRGLAEARHRGLNAELEIAGWIAPQTVVATRKLIDELGLKEFVILSDRYNQEDAPAVYGRAHACIMTKHNDPCPNTVLEALACGLPVLYSNTGGVPELAGDCGVALECEESWNEPKVPRVEDIAAGMMEIARNHASLSIAARARAVERFDIAHWLQRHEDVFQRLISERL